jgi:site-specific recombinase XerD
MENQLISDIEQEMLAHLDNHQMEQLNKVLIHYLHGITAMPVADLSENTNESLHASFLAAKRVEGCSSKSLRYYESTLNNMLSALNKPVKHITTDDLRQYLDKYQQKNGASKATIDNIRRILSSFFNWLEEENIILKSPVRRIHKVKRKITVKETYSDEALEIMRDHCGSIRDLACIHRNACRRTC